MKNIATKVLGIILGVGIIVMGVNLLSVDVSTIGRSIKFGADFYTEMYDVTQDVGRAVNQMIKSIHTCFGWLVIVIGAITTFNYLDKLVDALKAKTVMSKATKFEKSNQDVDVTELPDL